MGSFRFIWRPSAASDRCKGLEEPIHVIRPRARAPQIQVDRSVASCRNQLPHFAAGIVVKDVVRVLVARLDQVFEFTVRGIANPDPGLDTARLSASGPQA